MHLDYYSAQNIPFPLVSRVLQGAAQFINLKQICIIGLYAVHLVLIRKFVSEILEAEMWRSGQT